MRNLFLTLVGALLLTVTQAQYGDGFIPLFNGKNLDGWTATKENPESFAVEDGVLVCRGGRSHLFYTGPIGQAAFKNFELKLKARTTQGSNSGVYFHTTYQEEGWPNKGFEAQVNSTHTDPIKTGSLYGLVNMYAPGVERNEYTVKVSQAGQVNVYQPKAPSTDGEWFDYHLKVQGDTIVIKVNGQTTVDWTQPESWKTRPEGRVLDRGTFALQAHDPKCEVHYKEIRVKILP